MNLLRSLVESPAIHRLGWTLLHSVWEELAIAIVLAAALAVLRRRGAQARYAASCGAMLALAAAPVATFFLLPAEPPRLAAVTARMTADRRSPAPPPVAPALPSPSPASVRLPPVEAEPATLRVTESSRPAPEPKASPSADSATANHASADSAPAPAAARSATAALPAAEPAKQMPAAWTWAGRAREWLSWAAPWLVLAWLAGVLVLSIRNAGAWLAVQHLKSLSTSPVGPAVEVMARRLRDRLGMSAAVRLLQSARVDSPLVIGMVKPLILLPASVLTELPAAHLEALLAHELAHVLRHDYGVNLLQSVVETLLFYHPATWWVSRRIRAERENCCDDLALAVTRDRAAYARALAVVAGVRVPALAPAAAGGDLLPRLRRVLGKSERTRNAASASRWLAGALAGLLCVAALLVTRFQPRARAAPPAATDPATRPSTRPATPGERATAATAIGGGLALPNLQAPGECELTGRVVDADGKGVEGARVFLGNQFLVPNRGAPGANWRDGTTGPAVLTSTAHGRFSFNFVHPGRSDVWAESPAGCGWLYDVDTNGKGVKVRLQPKTDTVTYEGTITDADSKPVAGAKMILVNNNPVVVGEAPTDAAGQYRLQATPPWSYAHYLRLVCVRDGHAVAWATVPYCSGTGVDLRLGPTTQITGRVVNSRGRPVAGARVWVTGMIAPAYGMLESGRGLLDVAPDARTDDQGRYVIHELPMGSRVTIRTRHPEYGSTWGGSVDTAEPAGRGADLRLADPIVIEGTVRALDSGKPVAGAKVTLGYPSDPPEVTTTDKDGHYRFGGVDEFDGKSQREVKVEAGGSPPQLEGLAYYERALKAGDHAVLDVTVQRSTALRLADWKAQPGKPLETKSLVAILDDADPAYNGKEHYDDLLTLRDSAGKVVWQKTDLSVSQSVADSHQVVADPQRGSLWVAESVGQRLINYARDGRINWAVPDVRGDAIAIDPKTGNGWVLTSGGTINGEGLLVFGPDGQKLHDWKLKGFDIAYSAREDCFWTVGKQLQKIGRDGKVLAESQTDFPWCAVSVSVNEKDGSAWVAEGRHPNVTDSRGRIWIFEPDGRARKSFSLDVDNRCVRVDSRRGVAWVVGRTATYKVDLDGNSLAYIPIGLAALTIEEDTGYVWLASREGVWRLDTDGRPVWGEATSKSQKYLCVLPPAP